MANIGDYPKAKKYFKHCIKRNPSSAPANFGLAKILHHAEEKLEEALGYYLYVIEIDSSHYKALC